MRRSDDLAWRLIEPWIFREVTEGYRDVTAADRLTIYRRYAALALEHWRDDERGRATVLEFLKWHLNFWCRYAPQRADGSWPTMQERASVIGRGASGSPASRGDGGPRLARQRLLDSAPIDPAEAPPISLADDIRMRCLADGEQFQHHSFESTFGSTRTGDAAELKP